MEVEVDGFSLIDNTTICGMHGKDWTAAMKQKKGLKYTLITHHLAGILVERESHDPTMIPIGWVRAYTPCPGAELGIPKKKAPTPRRVVRKSKVA